MYGNNQAGDGVLLRVAAFFPSPFLEGVAHAAWGLRSAVCGCPVSQDTYRSTYRGTYRGLDWGAGSGDARMYGNIQAGDGVSSRFAGVGQRSGKARAKVGQSYHRRHMWQVATCHIHTWQVSLPHVYVAGSYLPHIHTSAVRVRQSRNGHPRRLRGQNLC